MALILYLIIYHFFDKNIRKTLDIGIFSINIVFILKNRTENEV
jgi:hypothetical protein